ncbi:MAG: hypothetical protein R6W90_00660, partial [Ignavibacteriaceae bacterium]
MINQLLIIFLILTSIFYYAGEGETPASISSSSNIYIEQQVEEEKTIIHKEIIPSKPDYYIVK